MEYQRAQILRGRSLKDLIVDRTLAGQGFGKSISSSIKDKTKAKLTGLKEKFDPMNISRMVGGRLGAYAYGKLAGRSEEDMAYFAGTRRRSSVTSDALGITPVKNDPLISKVSDGENRPVRKGDGLSTVMARIFNLLKRRILEEKKENEIAKNFEEEQENEKERRHKELLDALKNLGGGTASEEKKGKSFLERVIETVKKMLAKVFEKIKPLLKFVQSLYKLFSKGALGLAEGLLFLAKKIGGRKLALISMAIDAASAGTVGPAANEREDRAQTDPYHQSVLNNQTAMFKRGEISSDSIIESASLNAKKRQKLFSRSGIKRILDDSSLSKTQKEEKIGVKDLKEAEDWYESTKNESFAEFQGRVKNDAGKLVVQSGDTRKNLVVQKEDPESAKYVAPAPAAPQIIDVSGAGKDIIVEPEDVDNSVEPMPKASSVSPPPAVSAKKAVTPSSTAPVGRDSPAAAAAAKSSSAAAPETKEKVPVSNTNASAVKVEESAPKPEAATAVPASKPYIEVADGVRVDSNLPEVQIDNIKKSARLFGGLEDDEMWGNDKEGKLTKLKISGEKKNNKVLSEDKLKEYIRQREEQQDIIKKKYSDPNSSLIPTDNTLGQMFQKIQKEFDGLMLASDSTKFKPTIIDASKSVATSGGGNSGTIFSAPVRTDDDTLKLILKKNTHSFA